MKKTSKEASDCAAHEQTLKKVINRAESELKLRDEFAAKLAELESESQERPEKMRSVEDIKSSVQARQKQASEAQVIREAIDEIDVTLQELRGELVEKGTEARQVFYSAVAAERRSVAERFLVETKAWFDEGGADESLFNTRQMAHLGREQFEEQNGWGFLVNTQAALGAAKRLAARLHSYAESGSLLPKEIRI